MDDNSTTRIGFYVRRILVRLPLMACFGFGMGFLFSFSIPESRPEPEVMTTADIFMTTVVFATSVLGSMYVAKRSGYTEWAVKQNQGPDGRAKKVVMKYFVPFGLLLGFVSTIAGSRTAEWMVGGG